MRDGWKVKKLKDVLSIQNGYAFDSKKFHDTDGVQLIRIRDLKDGKTTVVKYQGEYDEKYIVSKGDLLIGMDGEFRCYEWQGSDSLLNQRVCRLEDFDRSHLEPRFLLYGINKFLKDIEDHTSYTTVKHISAKQIKNIEFPIAPVHEQKQIVSILDKAFAAIDQAKANIEKNIQNAEELFQSKLNEVFSQKGEGWEQKKLMDFGEIQTGSTPPTKDSSNYGDFIPFAKPPHFRSDGSINTGDSMLSEEGLKKGRLIKANSVLMVCIGATIGKTGYTTIDISANQQINALTPLEKYNAKIFYYSLISPKFQKDIMSLGNSAKATLPIINKTKWMNISVAVPQSVQVQDAIVNLFEKLNNKLDAMKKDYYRKLTMLDELKSSILQKAFSGELTSATEIVEQAESTV